MAGGLSKTIPKKRVTAENYAKECKVVCQEDTRKVAVNEEVSQQEALQKKIDVPGQANDLKVFTSLR